MTVDEEFGVFGLLAGYKNFVSGNFLTFLKTKWLITYENRNPLLQQLLLLLLLLILSANTQQRLHIVTRKTCVAGKNKLKCQGIPLIAAFSFDSSLCVSFRFAHLLYPSASFVCPYLYLPTFFYLFVVFKVVESTTTPKLSGAVLFFSYVAIAILLFVFLVCLYFYFFFIDEAANCFPSEQSRYSSTPD